MILCLLLLRLAFDKTFIVYLVSFQKYSFYSDKIFAHFQTSNKKKKCCNHWRCALRGLLNSHIGFYLYLSNVKRGSFIL